MFVIVKNRLFPPPHHSSILQDERPLGNQLRRQYLYPDDPPICQHSLYPHACVLLILAVVVGGHTCSSLSNALQSRNTIMSRGRIKGDAVGRSSHPGRASQTVEHGTVGREAFLMSTYLEKIADRVVGGGRECCVDIRELSSTKSRPVSDQRSAAEVEILAPRIHRCPSHWP